MFAQAGISFHYAHAIPLGEYKNQLNHQPNGMAFEYVGNVEKIKNLQLGGLFTVAMYQNEDHTGNVNYTETQSAYVETNEDDCYYIYQGLARYYLNRSQSKVRPYVQAQAGGISYFSTLAILQDEEKVFSGSTENHGTTWLVGLTGGLAFKIYDSLSLDLSMGYNDSGNVALRSSPEVEQVAQYRMDLNDHLVKSEVDHLSVKLGIMMHF